MTIAAAWVRKINDCEELIFAADSRLSGNAELFDGCPKILSLPRQDCALAFGGDTEHAFPMMLQLSLAIESFGPLRSRNLGLSALKTHTLKIFTGMAHVIKPSVLVHPPQPILFRDAEFLFGGYCWIQKKFKLWRITYSESNRRFVEEPAELGRYHPGARKIVWSTPKKSRKKNTTTPIIWAGDQADTARKLLTERLTESLPIDKNAKALDWEPFEVIRDILRIPELRDPENPESIGGAPQVVKVYQYMQTAPLGVFWPKRRRGKVSLQGRICLPYEYTDRWVLDPDSLRTESITKGKKRANDDGESESDIVDPHRLSARLASARRRT
jgi:hypothetical protein